MNRLKSGGRDVSRSPARLVGPVWSFIIPLHSISFPETLFRKLVPLVRAQEVLVIDGWGSENVMADGGGYNVPNEKGNRRSASQIIYLSNESFSTMHNARAVEGWLVAMVRPAQ
jgi:hypothetical protein